MKEKPFILIGSWQMKDGSYAGSLTARNTLISLLCGTWYRGSGDLTAMSGWYESWSSICYEIRQRGRDGKIIYRKRSVPDLNSLQVEYYCVAHSLTNRVSNSFKLPFLGMFSGGMYERSFFSSYSARAHRNLPGQNRSGQVSRNSSDQSPPD